MTILLHLYLVEGMKKFSWVSYKGTNPIHDGSTFMTYSLFKGFTS
jgi:hypothetical protein